MAKTYDVVIVGAGPAGIFASLELCDAGLDVLLLDRAGKLMLVFVLFNTALSPASFALHAIWSAASVVPEPSVMAN